MVGGTTTINSGQDDADRSARKVSTPANAAEGYPVREYIGAMAQELAEMARWDGDPVLAALLESAGVQAQGPRPSDLTGAAVPRG